MYRRKLKALGHHHPESFDVHDEDEFRNLVVWLEDQKIRWYKIEDRGELRDVKSSEWLKTLAKYLDDLKCPLDLSQKVSVVDWLLAHAVRVEYAENVCGKNVQKQLNLQLLAATLKEIRAGCLIGDHVIAEKYNSMTQSMKAEGLGGSSLDDSLINLTVDNPDLKAGVASLSRLLSLPEHPDHFVLLQAIRSLIEGKLSSLATKADKKSGKKTDVIPLQKVNLGFDTGDSAVNEAAKIIRLLHVTELRELQTRINEAIVAVQAITANPKTDQSLGRVGV